jgi:2-C-methyl-D-erythritol 2,4-cyclodiphosphate synthase
MFRVGFGFDAHPFEEGKPLILAGVRVDFPKGLKGHSDGDVVLHSITDAFLSAMGEQDIGQLFPDTDPKWKNADSVIFLKTALEKLHEKGYRIVNVDCTFGGRPAKDRTHQRKAHRKLSQAFGCGKGSGFPKGQKKGGVLPRGGHSLFLCGLGADVLRFYKEVEVRWRQ